LLPPNITAQPQGQSVKEGTNVTFSVSATGDAPLNYQWRFNGADISGANGSTYTRSNVTFFDGGNYSVVIGNPAGEVTSADAVLTVISQLPLKFDLISVLPDQRVRLMLSAEPGVYSLETSSNLTAWATLTNLTNVSGTFEFTDDGITNRTLRFYRAKQ
jgi:hypothetical protein